MTLNYVYNSVWKKNGNIIFALYKKYIFYARAMMQVVFIYYIYLYKCTI